MNHTQSPKSQPHFEEIRTLAYHLWREANGSLGQDLDFWLQAERQLMMRPALGETAPAEAPSAGSLPPTEALPNAKAAPAGRSTGRSAVGPALNGAAKRQSRTSKRPAGVR